MSAFHEGVIHTSAFQDKEADCTAKDTTQTSYSSHWRSAFFLRQWLQAAAGCPFSLLVMKTLWVNFGLLTNSGLAKKTFTHIFSVLYESWQVKKHLGIRQFLLLQQLSLSYRQPFCYQVVSFMALAISHLLFRAASVKLTLWLSHCMSNFSLEFLIF